MLTNSQVALMKVLGLTVRHRILGHIFPLGAAALRSKADHKSAQETEQHPVMRAEALVSEVYLGPSVNEITNSE